MRSFTDAAASADALVAVGVSVGDAACLAGAGEVVAAVRSVGPVPVLLGGPATDRAGAAALGADGWAPDAAAAADLIDQLRR